MTIKFREAGGENPARKEREKSGTNLAGSRAEADTSRRSGEGDRGSGGGGGRCRHCGGGGRLLGLGHPGLALSHVRQLQQAGLTGPDGFWHQTHVVCKQHYTWCVNFSCMSSITRKQHSIYIYTHNIKPPHVKCRVFKLHYNACAKSITRHVSQALHELSCYGTENKLMHLLTKSKTPWNSRSGYRRKYYYLIHRIIQRVIMAALLAKVADITTSWKRRKKEGKATNI